MCDVQCYLLQSPPKGITVPYRPLKPVTVATNLGPQQAVMAAVNNPAVTAGAGNFLPVSHAAGHNAAAVAAAAAAAASLNPANPHAATLIPAAQVQNKKFNQKSFFLFSIL